MHSFKGYSAPGEVLAGVRRGDIAAICLFSNQNVASPRQVRTLTMALRQAALEGGFPPPLIGIDQEGGQLIAIEAGATELPGNMALGAARSPALAFQAGRITGRELLAMGLNLNFAPSLDVNVNPDNPVIGIRSFGDSPTLVSELGTAFIQGLQETGVLATAKHFPGHGDTATDTHYGLSVVAHDLTRMEEIELAPFRAAIQAGVGAVMTAHVLFSAIDNKYPATLSSVVLNEFLRMMAGFEGLIITDAMDMWAVEQYGTANSIPMALRAGADLVMLGHLGEQMKLHRDMAPLVRPDALARIDAARRRTPIDLPPLSVVGCAEHQAIAQQIADSSITVVRQDEQLPIRLDEDDLIAVITPTPLDLTPADTSSHVQIVLAEAIRRRHARVASYEIPPQASAMDIAAILDAVDAARLVVVGTINATPDSAQAALIQAIHERGQSLLVVALRTPYDLVSFPMVTTYLCAYGIRPVTMEAVARVLFGEIEATGILPCAIPGVSVSTY